MFIEPIGRKLLEIVADVLDSTHNCFRFSLLLQSSWELLILSLLLEICSCSVICIESVKCELIISLWIVFGDVKLLMNEFVFQNSLFCTSKIWLKWRCNVVERKFKLWISLTESIRVFLKLTYRWSVDLIPLTNCFVFLIKHCVILVIN
jgi:hypothetical protein